MGMEYECGSHHQPLLNDDGVAEPVSQSSSLLGHDDGDDGGDGDDAALLICLSSLVFSFSFLLYFIYSSAICVLAVPLKQVEILLAFPIWSLFSCFGFQPCLRVVTTHLGLRIAAHLQLRLQLSPTAADLS